MDIKEQLERLSEALEKQGQLLVPTQEVTLVVKDIEAQFENFFSKVAREQVKTRFKEVVYPKPERKTIFLSARAYSAKGVEKAARAIADEVSRISAAGHLLGVLAPLSTIKLSKTIVDKDGRYMDVYLPGTDIPEGGAVSSDNWAVFCFPTVDWDFEPIFLSEANLKLYTREGEIGSLEFR